MKKSQLKAHDYLFSLLIEENNAKSVIDEYLESIHGNEQNNLWVDIEYDYYRVPVTSQFTRTGLIADTFYLSKESISSTRFKYANLFINLGCYKVVDETSVRAQLFKTSKVVDLLTTIWVMNARGTVALLITMDTGFIAFIHRNKCSDVRRLYSMRKLINILKDKGAYYE